MTTAQIIMLAMAGLSLVGNWLIPAIQARRAGRGVQPLPLPTGTPMPTSTQPTGQDHPILDDLLKVGQLVLSQQGGAGLQQLVALLLASLTQPGTTVPSLGGSQPTPATPDLQKILTTVLQVLQQQQTKPAA